MIVFNPTLHTSAHSLLAAVAITLSFGVLMHDTNLDKATSYALRYGHNQVDGDASGPHSHAHTHAHGMQLSSTDPRDKRKYRPQKRLVGHLLRDHIAQYDPNILALA